MDENLFCSFVLVWLEWGAGAGRGVGGSCHGRTTGWHGRVTCRVAPCSSKARRKEKKRQMANKEANERTSLVSLFLKQLKDFLAAAATAGRPRKAEWCLQGERRPFYSRACVLSFPGHVISRDRAPGANPRENTKARESSRRFWRHDYWNAILLILITSDITECWRWGKSSGKRSADTQR